MSDLVLTSLADNVLTIRLNRVDKKNALTTEMYGAMANALAKADSNNDIRATLILGAPEIFCAGNDIMDFIISTNKGEEGMRPVVNFLERIIQCQKPLIAGVDGAAIGVGTTMLLHCDYVVASKISSFKTPFVDLGIVPEAGSSIFAPHLMGHHKAFELLAMGESFTAQDAKEAGFVNRITSSGELELAATIAAKEIAAKPQEAMRITRELIRGDRKVVLERMREEVILFRERLASKEAQAAFAKFMAKS